MSKFAHQVFEEFAKSQNQPILLKKGKSRQLIEFIDNEDIPGEISEKLNLIVDYIQGKMVFNIKNNSEKRKERRCNFFYMVKSLKILVVF